MKIKLSLIYKIENDVDIILQLSVDNIVPKTLKIVFSVSCNIYKPTINFKATINAYCSK